MLKELIKKLNKEGEVYFKTKVNPGSIKTEIKSIMDDGSFKINVKAIPEKGKANIELIKFLSKEFEISKNNVKVISGVSDHRKLIKITKE